MQFSQIITDKWVWKISHFLFSPILWCEYCIKLHSRLSWSMLNDKFFRYTANLCLYVTVWGWIAIWNAQWGTSGSAIHLHSLQERRWLVVLFFEVPFHNKVENCVHTLPWLCAAATHFYGTEQWDTGGAVGSTVQRFPSTSTATSHNRAHSVSGAQIFLLDIPYCRVNGSGTVG